MLKAGMPVTVGTWQTLMIGLLLDADHQLADGLYVVLGGHVAMAISHGRLLLVAVRGLDAKARLERLTEAFQEDLSFLDMLKRPDFPAEQLQQDRWPNSPDCRPLFELVDWQTGLTRLEVPAGCSC